MALECGIFQEQFGADLYPYVCWCLKPSEYLAEIWAADCKSKVADKAYGTKVMQLNVHRLVVVLCYDYFITWNL